MISFRQKKTLIQNMMPKAMEYLEGENIPFNRIKKEDADRVSSVNSKAMVLVSFIKNEHGNYEIQVQDKKLYSYTVKLLKEIFRMNIKEVDEKNRTITAECNYEGIILDIIDILGRKYNLSLVC